MLDLLFEEFCNVEATQGAPKKDANEAVEDEAYDAEDDRRFSLWLLQLRSTR